MPYEPYKPWRYANREQWRQRQQRMFQRNARVRTRDQRRQVRQQQQPSTPFDKMREDRDEEEEDDGGGGLFGGIGDAVSDVASGAADIAGDVAGALPDAAGDVAGEIGGRLWDAVEAPARYVGEPAFAVASGQLEAERVQDPETGEYYREAPGWGDVAESLGTAFSQNPLDTYREAQQAFEERIRNPDLSGGARTALNIASDPLMAVPIGAAGRVGSKLPGPARAALTGRRNPVGAAFEGPGRAGPAMFGGAVAGAELGERSGLPYGEVVGQLAGGIGGGLAASRFLGRNAPEAMKAVEDTEGMELIEDPVRVRASELQTRPDLFQGRTDVDPNTGVNEAEVERIIENYDPLNVEMGLAAQDVNTGDLVVVKGHHRRAVQERMAERGMADEDAPWQVVRADLDDPDHVKRLRQLARESNYLTRKTSVADDVNVAREILVEEGGSAQDVQAALHTSSQYASDLTYLSTLPEDLITETVRRGARYENLAEIGRIARRHDMSEQDIRTLAGRYVFGQSSDINRTALREALEETSKIVQDAEAQRQAQMQGSMFEMEEFSGVSESMLDDIDELAELHRELARRRRGLTQARNTLESELGDDEGLDDALMQVEERIQMQLDKIEQEMEAPRAAIRREATGVREGDAGAGQGDRAPAAEGRPVPEEAGPAEAGTDAGAVEPQAVTRATGDSYEDAQQAIDDYMDTLESKYGSDVGYEYTMGRDSPLTAEEKARLDDLFAQRDAIGQQQSSEAFGAAIGGLSSEAFTPIAREKVEKIVRDLQQEAEFHQAMANPQASREGLVRDVYRKLADEAQFDLDWWRQEVTTKNLETALDAVQSPNRYPGWDPSSVLRQSQRIVDDIISPREGAADAGEQQLTLEAQQVEPQQSMAGEVLDAEGTATPQSGQMPVEFTGGGAPGARSATRPEQPRPTGGQQADASLGEPPRQMEGTPPAEGGPPGEPPIRGRGQQQPLGAEGRPLENLLDPPKPGGPKRRGVTGERTGKLSDAVGQKLKSSLGKLKGDQLPDSVRSQVDETVDPVIDEYRRMNQRISKIVHVRTDLEHAKMRAAGLEIRQGDDETYRLIANGEDMGLAEDVVERTSEAGRAAYARLTPEQQQALDVVRETNTMIDETLMANGATPAIDDTIEGEYWGRVALGRQYENIAGGTTRMEAEGPTPGTSRSVGANRIKPRTHQTIEEGIEAGIDYSNPWDARAARMRGKLMTAQDQWIKQRLGKLGETKIESTLGLEQVKGHPGFNNHWFNPEIARKIQRGLDKPQRGALEEGARSINNVLTPLRASFDLSATFQQGMRMWLTNPKKAGEYWWAVMRSLRDDDVYYGLLQKLDQEGPGVTYLAKRGIHYRGELAEGGLGAGEQMFTRGAIGRANKVGIGKGLELSNKAFARTLNAYSLHMANSQYKRLVAAGLEGEDLDEAMRLSVRGINRMFGWTDTQPTRIEEAAVFAPRYTRASAETIMKAINDGGLEGQMARRHMGLLMAEAAGAVWLLNELRGYETEWDPRDHNFLRFRNVGGLDVSPFGTYNTLFRAIAQTAAGDPFEEGIKGQLKSPWELMEGKLSPGVGAVYWPFIQGETYLGEPLDPLGDPLGTVQHYGQTALPFTAQSVIEEGPAAAAVSSTGVSSTPVTPAEKRDFRRDDVAQRMFGKPYEELSGADKSRVNEDPRVEELQAEADRNTLTRTGDRSKATEARLQMADQLDALSQQLEQGQITGNQWRRQYQALQQELRGSMDVLDIESRDDEVAGWFALYDQAETPSGQMDWEMLEGLQEQYAEQHPGIEEKIDKIVGTRDNQTLREYRKARDLAGEYYSIPAYAGMGLRESRRASDILQAANDMVSAGYARERDHALALLRDVDPDGVRLARQAADRGPNPKREQWRRDPDHRLMFKFYSDFSPRMIGAA